MNKNNIKYFLPAFVFILFLIPIVTSSLLDLKQKIANDLLLKQEQDARDKIYLTGKFDPSQNENFTEIPEEYSISGYKMYLRKETLDAFLKMAEVAKLGGIELKIASATRNFIYQENIWDNKWTGYTLVERKDLSKSIPDGLERFKKILEYSATPGTSRHHWGTDIDLNNANIAYFETKEGKKVYEWLTVNAPIFGFCQPYNLKGSSRPTGYNEEKWHWSYLPLSKDFTKKYKELIKDEDINGFSGEEYVPSLDLMNNYILSINPACL